MGSITVRLENVKKSLEQKWQECMYCQKDFCKKVEELECKWNSPAKQNILSELYKMLEGCGVSYKKGEEIAYYKALVANTMVTDSIEEKMIMYLYAIFEEYPTPEQYMLRIVNKLERDIQWHNDTLRLRILKQFVKYGNFLSDAGYGGKRYITGYVRDKLQTGKNEKLDVAVVADNLDDHIFDVLLSAEKAPKKEDQYGLLSVADELAKGIFRENGAAKERMYYFGLVYGMSYTCEATNKDIDDIEKMFTDYYSNNLMRFMEETETLKSGGFEREPSGQTINVKNYGEVIFLYYLNQKNMLAADKIKNAFEMIERIKKSAVDSNYAKKKRLTTWYAECMLDDSIFEMNSDEFQDFLLDNYHCSSKMISATGSSYPTHFLRTEAEQNSAYRQYTNLISELEEKLLVDGKGFLDACTYGLWINLRIDKGGRLESLLEIRTEEDRKKYTRFCNLMNTFHNQLKRFVSEGTKERADRETAFVPIYEISHATLMKRTSLISAFYYLFNNEFESKTVDYSFAEYYEVFKKEIDEYLKAAYYQPLNSKNIFDILVVFSSFLYANF